jgi:hypothetical protein
MIKKLGIMIIFCFLIIGAVNAAEFKINDGFNPVNEFYSVNDENDMHICTWDYDNETFQEAYFHNSSSYTIVPGDNNTYNTTEDYRTEIQDAISIITANDSGLDHGILEVAEFDGKKYIIYAYIEAGTADDWKTCYDELMKFNENNNIEPIADAI